MILVFFRIPVVVFALIFCAAGFLCASSQAQEADLPVSFTADTMDVDRNLGIVTARGNVEVIHGGRTLMADTVTYNQKEELVTASGNIVLIEPGGDVIFAEYMELHDNLKDGIVSDIRMILSDSSRVAANGARRENGDLELSKAVYSPCNLCEDDPDQPPLWQVKAIRVFHDKSRKVVEYTDAWLEMAGFPIFYTPFLAHPDPTVKRESGFLAPTFGRSTTLGAIIKTPYFINLSEHSDATLTPALYSKQGDGVEAEYRERFLDGELNLSGSFAHDDDVGARGHTDSFGRFNIDPTWRWGFDLERTSDDTYQRRYNLESKRTLTSSVFAEGFRKNNYLRGEGIFFQGLRRKDDEGKTPIVSPLVNFSHVGTPGRYGGRTTLDAGTAFLTQEDGADSYRFSLKPGWETNYVSNLGEQYQFAVTLDADAYFIDDFTPQGDSHHFNGTKERLFPKAQLDWNLPLAKSDGSIQQVIEPAISFIASPNGGNPEEIPNFDSQEFEFDETSLFQASRFAGNDQVEGGTRIDYGGTWGVYGAEGGFTNIFAGQSYRLREDDTFADGSGLEDNFSDLVAKAQVSPNSYFDLLYRTRLDKDQLSVNRNEISMQAGVPLLELTTQYREFIAQKGSKFGNREDITASVSSQLSDRWSANVSGLRDIKDQQTRRLKFGVIYEDECLIYTAQLKRSFFKDRDLRPEDVIIVRLTFKTLGDIQLDY